MSRSIRPMPRNPKPGGSHAVPTCLGPPKRRSDLSSSPLPKGCFRAHTAGTAQAQSDVNSIFTAFNSLKAEINSNSGITIKGITVSSG
jgi:hypothetical protein